MQAHKHKSVFFNHFFSSFWVTNMTKANAVVISILLQSLFSVSLLSLLNNFISLCRLSSKQHTLRESLTIWSTGCWRSKILHYLILSDPSSDDMVLVHLHTSSIHLKAIREQDHIWLIFLYSGLCPVPVAY